VTLQVSVCSGRSTSVAVAVVTKVRFSLTAMEAVAPPPSLVNSGAELTSSTVTTMVWLSVRFPVPSSVAVT